MLAVLPPVLVVAPALLAGAVLAVLFPPPALLAALLGAALLAALLGAVLLTKFCGGVVKLPSAVPGAALAPAAQAHGGASA